MTAPTLPAMPREDIAEIRKVHYRTDEAFARAIISARDAQWAAREQSLRARILELEEAHEHGAGVIENLHSVMVAAAEEIHEHWQAHCDEEGYGPANLMHRLEKGIPAQYAYKAGDFERLMQERAEAVARLDAAVRDERERWIAPSLAALAWMEGAWHRIDGEWGPCGKSLDEACANGDEPEIAGLRARTKD